MERSGENARAGARLTMRRAPPRLEDEEVVEPSTKAAASVKALLTTGNGSKARASMVGDR